MIKQHKTKYWLIVILLFISLYGVTQTDNYRTVNKDRITALKQFIKKGLNNEEYNKVISLNKEKKIRVKLEHAYSSSAPKETILAIKKELINCNCLEDNQSNDIELLEKEIRHAQNYKNKPFVLYIHFTPGSYMHSSYSYVEPNYLMNEPPNPPTRETKSYYGVGFKIGSSFYFNHFPKKYENFKIGLDLSYFSFFVGIGSNKGNNYQTHTVHVPVPRLITLNYPQPGIICSWFINNNRGINAKANIGFSQTFAENFHISGLGYHIGVNYWSDKLVMELYYSITSSLYKNKSLNNRISNIGLSIGLRF